MTFCTCAVARGAAPSMTPAEAHRIPRARESLQLELRFESALIGELQAGRWAAEATSVRDGRARPIAPVTWQIAGVSAVQPGPLAAATRGAVAAGDDVAGCRGRNETGGGAAAS